MHLAGDPVALHQDGTVPFGSQRPLLQVQHPAVAAGDQQEHREAEGQHAQRGEDAGGKASVAGEERFQQQALHQREGDDEDQRGHDPGQPEPGQPAFDAGHRAVADAPGVLCHRGPPLTPVPIDGQGWDVPSRLG